MYQRAWDGEKDRLSRVVPSREDGASAVEFSLVLSLIVMVAWGIIQFGFVMNRYQGLQAATREGARSGAKSQATIAGIQNTVETALEPVVARSKFVNPCPPDPATLSDGTYCVDVARRDTPTSAPVLLTTTGYDSSVQPCNLGHNKVVVVTVRHRMSYSLVLWSGTINANTAGEFRCES